MKNMFIVILIFLSLILNCPLNEAEEKNHIEVNGVLKVSGNTSYVSTGKIKYQLLNITFPAGMNNKSVTVKGKEKIEVLLSTDHKYYQNVYYIDEVTCSIN